MPPSEQSEANGFKVVDPDFRTFVLDEAASSNLCENDGFELLYGSWDFKGKTRLEGFRNRLVFRGNSFTEFLAAKDGEDLEQAIITGHYACLSGGRLLFSVEAVEPRDGGFGNTAGSKYVCTLLWNTEQMGKAMALVCHVDWDPARTMDFVYTRSGL
jgi:hypothetical protein